MASIDYEKLACKALALPHPSHLNEAESYHFLGHFVIGDPTPALDAITQRRREVVEHKAGSVGAELVNENDVAPKMLLTYAKYIEYLKIIRQLQNEHGNAPWVEHFADSYNPVTMTADLAGFREYLRIIPDRDFQQFLDRKVEVHLPEKEQRLSTYILGKQGSGKSTLLKTLIHSYTNQPKLGAVVVLEPHGDLSQEVARFKELRENRRLVYIDPTLSSSHAPCFNPLEMPPGANLDEFATDLVGIFQDMLAGSGGTDLTNNMLALLQNCIPVLLEHEGATLRDLLDFMGTGDRHEKWLERAKQSRNELRRDFFTSGEFESTKYNATKGSLQTKLRSVLSSEAEQRFFLGRNTFDLEALINDRKVIIFNLAKGRIGSAAAQALGRFVLGRVAGIALRRAADSRSGRSGIHAFLDECQNYVGTSVATMLEEARKYGLDVTLANQHRLQITDRQVRETVLRLTNTKFVGRSEADRWISKVMETDEQAIANLPNAVFICKRGENKPFRLHVANLVVDDRNAMTARDWKAEKERQLATYYAPIIEETPPIEQGPGLPELI